MDLVRIIVWSLLAVSNLHAQRLIIVEGAAGSADYEQSFAEQTAAWEKAGSSFKVTALRPKAEDQLRRLEAALKESPADQPLWLALHGHGSFDGREAKFNLLGPDLTAAALAAALAKRTGPTVVVLAFSASGAFVKSLAGPQRVIVSATQNGLEQNYSRFGQYFAAAIGSKGDADLDQDGAVSVLEAFLSAARSTAGFYETEERIATEHAVLDDNGDGTGTRSEAFTGVRPNKPTDDGLRAHQVALILSAEDAKLTEKQRSERDALELQVQQVIQQRKELGEDAYYQKLEALFLKIAAVTRPSGK
jgi:hypothetical protein